MVKRVGLLFLILAALLSPLASLGCSQPESRPSPGIYSSREEINKLYHEVALPTYKVVAPEWSGSAVAVGPRTLVTAAHVVTDELGNWVDGLKVFSRLGPIKVIADATVKKVLLTKDLAIIRVNVDLPYHAELADEMDIYAVTWGSTIVSSGYSLGTDDPVVTIGRVTSMNNDGYIQHSAESTPGNSGGPLLVWSPPRGRFVVYSILQAGYTPFSHMALGVNPWTLREFVKGGY